MRVLVIYSHPVETSFNSALHQEVLKNLRASGHEVDDCDLYAEDFNPVLGRAERLGYHDVPSNRLPVQRYVDRLLWAEALVFCFPTWCFGMPAILKGFFDRVLMPGVAFDISDPQNVKPALTHIKRISAVVTYGRPRWTALLMGDPPRKSITRYLKLLTGGRARTSYHAQYHMNVATPERLNAFKAKVGQAMLRFV
jgi:NAD(P)H dehydrogenase (quinone)